MTQLSSCHRSTHVSCYRRKTCPKLHLHDSSPRILDAFLMQIDRHPDFQNVLCIYGYGVYMGRFGRWQIIQSFTLRFFWLIAIMFLQPSNGDDVTCWNKQVFFHLDLTEVNVAWQILTTKNALPNVLVEPWGQSRDPEAEDSIFRDAWKWRWMYWYDVFVFWWSCLKILFSKHQTTCLLYPPKKKPNMTMEHPRLEDVFPIEQWWFSNVMLDFRGCNISYQDFGSRSKLPRSAVYVRIDWVSGVGEKWGKGGHEITWTRSFDIHTIPIRSMYGIYIYVYSPTFTTK